MSSDRRNFLRGSRRYPDDSYRERPEEWLQFWIDCLADHGILGVQPFASGSWYVAIHALSAFQLEKCLQAIVECRGGLKSLGDSETALAMDGGLALSAEDQGVIVVPMCCVDLSNVVEWKRASTSAGKDWEMLWIGHPWISMKAAPPWLLLSDLHEMEPPVGRWAVRSEELRSAVAAAEAELAQLAEQIASILTAWNYEGDPTAAALTLVGLGDA